MAQQIKSDYMDQQPDLSWKMRSIAIDWLAEVIEEYSISTEAFFLSVQYLDRFLSFTSVSRSKLQLVATVCLWIASKYVDVYPPPAKDMVDITANAFKLEELKAMEIIILNKLQFSLQAQTAYEIWNNTEYKQDDDARKQSILLVLELIMLSPLSVPLSAQQMYSVATQCLESTTTKTTSELGLLVQEMKMHCIKLLDRNSYNAAEYGNSSMNGIVGQKCFKAIDTNSLLYMLQSK